MWAVGYNEPVKGSFGVVHSSDGGRSWKELSQVHEYAGPDIPPAFWFLDHTQGWVSWWDLDGTDEPKVIRTQDGGEHWQTVSRRQLQHVIFFDENHGYGTDDTKFVRTSDGGHTWTEFEIPHLRFVHEMVFLTPDIGWIASTDGKDFLVFRTTNGGRDWEESRTTSPGDNADVIDMSFVDRDRGWLITRPLGNTYLFSTVDGGKNWVRDTNSAFQGKSKSLEMVRFLSKERGLIFVNEGKGTNLMYTIDGGAHWARQQLPRSISARFISHCQIFEGDLLCSVDEMTVLTLHPTPAR